MLQPLEAVEKLIGWSAKLLLLDEPVAPAPVRVEVVAFLELELAFWEVVQMCFATKQHVQP